MSQTAQQQHYFQQDQSQVQNEAKPQVEQNINSEQDQDLVQKSQQQLQYAQHIEDLQRQKQQELMQKQREFQLKKYSQQKVEGFQDLIISVLSHKRRKVAQQVQNQLNSKDTQFQEAQKQHISSQQAQEQIFNISQDTNPQNQFGNLSADSQQLNQLRGDIEIQQIMQERRQMQQQLDEIQELKNIYQQEYWWVAEELRWLYQDNIAHKYNDGYYHKPNHNSKVNNPSDDNNSNQNNMDIDPGSTINKQLFQKSAFSPIQSQFEQRQIDDSSHVQEPLSKVENFFPLKNLYKAVHHGNIVENIDQYIESGQGRFEIDSDVPDTEKYSSSSDSSSDSDSSSSHSSSSSDSINSNDKANLEIIKQQEEVTQTDKVTPHSVSSNSIDKEQAIQNTEHFQKDLSNQQNVAQIEKIQELKTHEKAINQNSGCGGISNLTKNNFLVSVKFSLDAEQSWVSLTFSINQNAVQNSDNIQQPQLQVQQQTPFIDLDKNSNHDNKNNGGQHHDSKENNNESVDNNLISKPQTQSVGVSNKSLATDKIDLISQQNMSPEKQSIKGGKSLGQDLHNSAEQEVQAQQGSEIQQDVNMTDVANENSEIDVQPEKVQLDVGTSDVTPHYKLLEDLISKTARPYSKKANKYFLRQLHLHKQDWLLGLRRTIDLEHTASALSSQSMDQQGAIYCLCGKNKIIYVCQSYIILGRNTSIKKNMVEVDLSVEGQAQKVSRMQAVIELRANAKFYIQNIGQSPIVINGQRVETNNEVELPHLGHVMIRGLSFIFLANLNSVKRLIQIQKNIGKMNVQAYEQKKE